MRKIIALLIILCGVSMLNSLWPLPAQQTSAYRSKAAIDLVALPSVDKSSNIQNSLRSLNQEIIKDSNLEMKFWFKWLKQFLLILICTTAGYLMMVKAPFWRASVLITTAIYAWSSSFFFSLYPIFIQSTHSFSDILRRFEIAKPLLLNIMWFNLIMPLTFIIASYIAIKSIWVQRKTTLTNHSIGTPNGAP